MKIFQANSVTLGRAQTLFLVSVVVLAFWVDWTMVHAIGSLFMFYAYSAYGVGMTYHRYWSHKSFEFKNRALKWLFTLLAMMACRGSPIGWVYVHRLHHANTDTDKDPHSPSFGFRWFSIKTTVAANKLDHPFIIRDFLKSKVQIKLNDYYFLIVAIGVGLMSLLGLNFVFFAWLLPVVLTQLSLDLFTYCTHVDIGYRNYETKDNSQNVSWLFPLVLSEAWHNNHHGQPRRATTQTKEQEKDPIFKVIRLVGKEIVHQ